MPLLVPAILTADRHGTYVKRVSRRSTESRGVFPGTPVSSHTV